MATNVFQTGVSRGPSYRNNEIFPYEQDKHQKSIRTFTITKVFDAKKKKWKMARDYARDADLTKREQSLQSLLNLQVDYAFSVNNVGLNSGLNADLASVLNATWAGNLRNEFDLVRPFVTDYELNHR